MNNYNVSQSVDKSFSAFHKRILLYFISAEPDFLKSASSFPAYIESMVNELNSLGFHRSKIQWLELMQTWINSISTSSDPSQVSSTEDKDLQQYIAENQLWSNPSIDQIGCVAQYLESNSKASNLWKMMSFELNQMGNVKEDDKFWMEVFHRYARRLNARKDLIDYLTTKYKTSPFPALTKLENRILKVIPIEQATSKNSTQRARTMKKTQLINLSTHCRVCLTGASSKMVYLFDERSDTQKVDSISVLNMLNFCGCFSNEAHIDDGLPQYICIDCSALIENAYKLRTLCAKTEEKFSDVLCSKNISNKVETKPTTSDPIDEYGLTMFDENIEIDTGHNAENVEIKCDACADVFFDNTIFIEHLRTHGEHFVPKEKFSCPECNKIYRGKHSLNIHMRTHSGERPFVCQICGKTFKTPGSRNKHTVVHSMERNHKCLLCPFVTNTQANLRVHERSHSGIKPYECRLCPLKFSTASNMAKHIRNIHEKEKPHKCEQCGRAFFSRESLRMHSVTHTGLKPFICPKKECLAAFGWYRKLKKHVLKDHANENIRIPTEKSYFEQLQMHLN